MIKKIVIVVVLVILPLGIYYFYPEPKLPSNTKINSLIVYKSKRQMEAYFDGKLLKVYKISLGRNPIGDKQFEGDKKTPEGVYYINAKNPKSGYHKNLGISYPDKEDVKISKTIGKPSGGDVKIHGLKNGQSFISKFQRWYDWTAGCIAVTNEEVDELYETVDIGTKIEIKP